MDEIPSAVAEDFFSLEHLSSFVNRSERLDCSRVTCVFAHHLRRLLIDGLFGIIWATMESRLRNGRWKAVNVVGQEWVDGVSNYYPTPDDVKTKFISNAKLMAGFEIYLSVIIIASAVASVVYAIAVRNDTTNMINRDGA